MTRAGTKEQLHAAESSEELEREIMELALGRTGARDGALFLWDGAADGLVLARHMVGGLTVTIPDRVLKRGDSDRSPGIALWVFDHDEPYLCGDSRDDPIYTRYLVESRSIAAVPIRYQNRPIGVITVSAPEPHAFDAGAIETLEHLARSSATFLRRAQLDRESRERTGRPFLIKGLSPGWLEVERRIEAASPTNAPILIRGESGTGKDLVARFIHFNSRRSGGPYVTVNCAAIPETMLESILFGHKKGAFTGASFEKIGEFKKADGGTLFLDEVGELPMLLQAKVLRAVEQGEVQPLGSNEPARRVDVRLICATNRDLAEMARRGEFRDDLYYRLGVMTMELPPLRSYKDNIEVLAHVFAEQAAERHELAPPEISAAAMSCLRPYDYPGNVRELKNAMEHAVIMSGGAAIAPEHLPVAMTGRADTPAASEATGARTGETAGETSGTLREMRERWLAPLERRYLAELLEECSGNVRKAAARAGINPVTMYRLLKKRGLEVTRSVRASGEEGR